MKNILNIADLRLAAKKRLPRVVFDYIDGGAETEWTMRENARVFDDVVFRPRSAVATKHCDLRMTVLGETIDVPFLFAPVGSSPHVLSARRGGGGARGGRRRHDLHPLHAGRLSGARREGGDARAGLVSALSHRRPRRRPRRNRAREERGLLRARRHHRHAGRRIARARRAQRREGAGHRRAVHDASVRLPDSRAAALAL